MIPAGIAIAVYLAGACWRYRAAREVLNWTRDEDDTFEAIAGSVFIAAIWPFSMALAIAGFLRAVFTGKP